MRCPNCRTLSRMLTKDSREWKGLTRRRKHCVRCSSEFYTVENFETDLENVEQILRREILDEIRQAISGMGDKKKPLFQKQGEQ